VTRPAKDASRTDISAVLLLESPTSAELGTTG